MENFKNSNNKPTGAMTLKPRREIVIEELQTEFDKQLDKISIINDFMSLFGARDEIKEDLTALRSKTKEVKEFVGEAREKIHFFKTVQLPETQELIQKMRSQHLEMLQMLEDLDANDLKEESSATSAIDNGTNSSSNVESPKLSPKPNRQTFVIASKMNTITPKRHQSPFVLRADPRVLSKLNKQFEININPTEFDKVPKYLKGRDSIDELSTFLETVIVKCFLDKYTLLHRDRENVQPANMQRWKMYRSQMEYFPGEMFITEGDIATLIGRMMDKKMNNRIALLRHLHIIQDVRRGSVTCYIWKAKK